jgi:hypothetical protein
MAYPKRLFIGLDLSLANGWPNNQGGNVEALAFTVQPQSTTVDEYATATFTAAADNATSYQWSKNAANVGTDSTSYSFATTAADNGAVVNVTATGAGGSTVSSNATLTVVSYAFQLDGLTQYFWLSEPVAFTAGDSVEIDVVIPVSAPASDVYLLDGPTRAYLFIKPDRTFFYNQARVLFTLDGSPFVSGSQIPLDGLPHKIVGVYQGAHNLQSAGISHPLASSTLFSGIIKGLLMVRSAGNITIPLNNKSQGANQLATVGSVNATIVNYNVSGWVVV